MLTCLTVKFEVIIADVSHQTAKVSPVIAENKVTVLYNFRHSTIDKLAGGFTTGPGSTGRATSGQDPDVAHGGPVLALQDESAFAPVR